MNNLKKMIAGSLTAMVLLTACEKDEVRTVAVPPESGAAVTASTTTVLLENDKADQEAVTIDWTPVSYGYEGQVVNYLMEMDLKGGDFSSPQQLDLGTAVKKVFTHSELNRLLINLGLVPGQSSEVEARIVAGLGNGRALPTVSPALALTATPYFAIRVFPSLYVPGGHQGWSPETAPVITSVNNDDRYEGYVNFTEAGQEFKLTSQPDWDGTNYGDGGPGKLSTDGGNLKVPVAGYYQVKADVKALTYSVTKTDWGVIGDATASGWDADQDLVYEAATGTLQAVLTLTVGEIKFRANDDWGLNFGDEDGDGVIEEGGANIKIEAAGTYLVTLDLGNGAGNYSYSLTRQ